MVPNDWCIVNLKDVTTKIQDGNYGADYPKKEELLPSGIPFLTSKVLGGDGKINASKYDFISLEKHVSLKKAQITTDDILFTNRGANVGVVAVAGSDLADANIGPQLTLIRVDTNLSDNDYLYFFMKSPFFQRQVKGQDSGSAMNFFGIKATEKFKIILPPLPEQRKIAKILSTWDKAISTTERLIDNSKQQKKALMQQLLTGKKRLLDDSGKPFEGVWEEVKLSQLVKVIGGNAFKSEEFKSEGIPLVKISNIKPNYSICLDSTVFIAENEKFEKFKIMKGHVLIAMSGATTGKVGCYQSEKFAYLNQRVGRFDVKQGRAINQYLFQLLKLPKVQHEILIDAVGGAQPNISNKDIERIKISVPAVKEQQKIASVLSNADQEIELLEQQLADLKQEKKALMQQLLTGKRRVKVDNTEAA